MIRTDTTVVESNIHYPTDSSLLWDTWRVATRLLERARDKCRESVPHRFHTRKVKKPWLNVTRYITSKSKARQEKVKAWFRTLIERVDWIVALVGDFCKTYRSSSHQKLSVLALDLAAYLPSMQTVAATARRANMEGETVLASERVFSLFESHTELIKRGRRQKPVEFGHKVLLCETAEKFITDYEVYEQQQPDCSLTEPVIERHKQLFGERPVVLARATSRANKRATTQDLTSVLANRIAHRSTNATSPEEIIVELLNRCQVLENVLSQIYDREGPVELPLGERRHLRRLVRDLRTLSPDGRKGCGAISAGYVSWAASCINSGRARISCVPRMRS
ncbi:MAG: hypothetical protein ACYC3X_01900 [Pirellulaceae bacterium]